MSILAIVLVVSGVLLLPKLLSSVTSTAKPTATALTTSPASHGRWGGPVTLTAAITPAVAIGTVQFMDGATSLGAPATVLPDGTASATTSSLSAGPHQLTAVFTPSNPADFGPSASPSVTFTITTSATPPPVPPVPLPIPEGTTMTVLTISPGSPVAQGSRVLLIARITPSAAAGTVQFKDGDTDLGSPAPVANGTASGTTARLSPGSHQLSAVFIPDNPAAFSPSTSPTLIFTVTAIR